MKKIILLALLAVGTTVFFNACKKDVPVVVEVGTVTGRIVSESNHPLGQTMVFVDADGEIYMTYTNPNGTFSLDAPVGMRTFYVETGDGSIFRTTFDAEVIKDQTVEIQADVQLRMVGDLAFVAGAYDEIQSIIIDSLGYTATQITMADLADFNLISQYNAIFMNCGAGINLDSTTWANLSQYVSNGGSLYASDYASEYLIGNYLAGACPNNRNGGFITNAQLCTEKTGNSGWVNGAQVTSPDLQAYLGNNTMDIDYDLGGWEQIVNYDPNFWEVLVADPTGQNPLMIRTNQLAQRPANGHVGNANPQWVTICHIPPGNPGNPQTITINVNAWPAHQAHGDSQGACNGGGGGHAGTIYFTTFHNHANDAASPDVMNILEYVILNM